jgi:hypothetical protein
LFLETAHPPSGVQIVPRGAKFAKKRVPVLRDVAPIAMRWLHPVHSHTFDRSIWSVSVGSARRQLRSGAWAWCEPLELGHVLRFQLDDRTPTSRIVRSICSPRIATARSTPARPPAMSP